MRTVHTFVNLRGEPIDMANLHHKGIEQRRIERSLGIAHGRKPTKKNGYAAVPGTGPAGETCKTCRHKERLGNYGGKSFIKCLLRKATWTHGEGTDILASSPACSKWEDKQS